MENFKLSITDGIVTDVETLKTLEGEFEDVNGERVPKMVDIKGRLFVPKEVKGFAGDALIFVNAEAIEVEDGNEVYTAKGNCLIEKATGKLIFGCKNSMIPNDGTVTEIGSFAFNYPGDLSEMNLYPLTLPDSVKSVGFRALAISTDNDVILVLPRVESLETMSLMVTSDNCRIIIFGNPKMEVGVFGTKAELDDPESKFVMDLPDAVYRKQEGLTVVGQAGTTVEEYCNRFGIKFTAIGNFTL